MNFHHLKTFINVVDCQGFSAAGRLVNLSPIAISKQIKNLENELNVQLIERTSTKFVITDVGLLFYNHALQILKDINNLGSIIQSFKSDPKGDLKVFSSIAFGEKYIIPYLEEFFKNYPQIILHLDFSDRIPNVQKERIDLCFGLTGHWDLDLIQKKLFETVACVLASPAYLEKYGEPQNCYDLLNHRFVCYSGRTDPLAIQFFKGEKLYIKPAIFINNHQSFLSCALQGLGLIYTYEFFVKELISQGSLKKILKDEIRSKITYYGYYPSTDHIKPAFKVMLDFVFEKILKNSENFKN